MVHPNDLAMREKILAELRRLDLTYVKACHLKGVDVSLFLSSLWDNIPPPNPAEIGSPLCIAIVFQARDAPWRERIHHSIVEQPTRFQNH